MKLLCLVQRFQQGWGGAPESVRLLAQLISPRGYSLDVYDRGRLHRAVETLDLLPDPAVEAERFDGATLDRYGAILVAGPWQNPRWLWPILARRAKRQKLIYLPRGGLGRIEFARRLDLKKWSYFHLLERRIIDASSAIVFSSHGEQRHTIAAARNRSREVVIPDFFNAPSPLPRVQPAGAASREVHFAFMAEIAPRKGLLPLVAAFVQFCSRPGLSRPARLSVGGSIRAGSEAYFAEARALAEQAPDNARIEFLGPIAHRDRPQFYRDADIFLVPSLFESYGLTVLEGLAAGCAEVAGPDLGVLEYLPAHERLTVARSIDPVNLADALARQFEIAAGSGPQDRARTCEFASQAIAALNQTAMQRWRDLLGG